LKIKTTKETKEKFLLLKGLIVFQSFFFLVKIKSDYFENKIKKVADEKCFHQKVSPSN
jgi:hypothetical protein